MKLRLGETTLKEAERGKGSVTLEVLIALPVSTLVLWVGAEV